MVQIVASVNCVFEVQDPKAPTKRTHRIEMGEAPAKFGAQCAGDLLSRQRDIGSEGDAF